MEEPIVTRLLALFALLLAAYPLAAQTDPEVAQGSEPYVYQVERLNTGLSPADPPLELDTPQALLESFIDAAQADQWRRAATALDLSNIAAGDRNARGEQLAKMTYEIVNRSITIDWRSLSDRPDAVDVVASNKDPMAGEARRSIVLGHLEADGRSYAIRIARLQAPGGEPVWMFSRQSVENMPALFDAYGPTRFEQALPQPLRKQAFWTLAWWEVIALPILLLLAAAAAGLTYRAISRLRSATDEDTMIHGVLRAVHLPASLLALAGTFALIRAFALNFTGMVALILDPLQVALVIAAVAAIFLTAINAVIDFATDRRTQKLEEPENEASRDFFTRMGAIRRIITVLVILFGLGIVLVQTNLTQSLGFTLLASAGVLGLILVFAARQVLGDLMASVQIAFAKTARIGDAVYYDDQWCYVERIGFTHLRLRTWDERRVMAPVGDFIGSSFENWTKSDPSVMTHAELLLDHRADLDALREEFRAFVESDDDVVDKDDAEIQVVGHSAQGIDVRFLARAKDPKIGWKMRCRLQEAMIAAVAKLDAGSDREPAPAFLPREREVRMDLARSDEAD